MLTTDAKGTTMVTALLILAAVLVLVLFVGVCHQMFNSPAMWVYHTCTGTPGFLIELFGAILSAIISGFTSNE